METISELLFFCFASRNRKAGSRWVEKSIGELCWNWRWSCWTVIVMKYFNLDMRKNATVFSVECSKPRKKIRTVAKVSCNQNALGTLDHPLKGNRTRDQDKRSAHSCPNWIFAATFCTGCSSRLLVASLIYTTVIYTLHRFRSCWPTIARTRAISSRPCGMRADSITYVRVYLFVLFFISLWRSYEKFCAEDMGCFKLS